MFIPHQISRSHFEEGIKCVVTDAAFATYDFTGNVGPQSVPIALDHYLESTKNTKKNDEQRNIILTAIGSG